MGPLVCAVADPPVRSRRTISGKGVLARPDSASRVRSGAYQLTTGIRPPDKSLTAPLAPSALRGL